MNSKEVDVYDLKTVWQCWVTDVALIWNVLNPSHQTHIWTLQYFIFSYQGMHSLYTNWKTPILDLSVFVVLICVHMSLSTDTSARGSQRGELGVTPRLPAQGEGSSKPKERGHPAQNIRNCCPLGISSPGPGSRTLSWIQETPPSSSDASQLSLLSLPSFGHPALGIILDTLFPLHILRDSNFPVNESLIWVKIIEKVFFGGKPGLLHQPNKKVLLKHTYDGAGPRAELEDDQCVTAALQGEQPQPLGRRQLLFPTLTLGAELSGSPALMFKTVLHSPQTPTHHLRSP